MNTECRPGNRDLLILIEIKRLVDECADGVFAAPQPGELPSEAVARRLAQLEPRLARIQSLRSCVGV